MEPHTVFVIPPSSRVLAYCFVPAEAGEALEMEPTTLNTILAKAMQVGGMACPCMRAIAHRGTCPWVALACSTDRVQQRMSCCCITDCQLPCLDVQLSQAWKAAEAAKKARELVRRKSVLVKSTLPGVCV